MAGSEAERTVAAVRELMGPALVAPAATLAQLVSCGSRQADQVSPLYRYSTGMAVLYENPVLCSARLLSFPPAGSVTETLLPSFVHWGGKERCYGSWLLINKRGKVGVGERGRVGGALEGSCIAISSRPFYNSRVDAFFHKKTCKSIKFEYLFIIFV